MRILLLLALVACSHDRPTPPPAVESTTGAPGSQDLAPLAGLPQRLHREAAERPAAKVPAETLFAALAQHGVALASTKQVLAATAQAAYCALGVTRENVAIAVCEYPTADAARAGKQLLDTRYAQLVPDAVRALNGNTLVTVANASRHQAIRDQVLATFTSL